MATPPFRGQLSANTDMSELLYRAACIQEDLIQHGFDEILENDKYYANDFFDMECIVRLFGPGPWATSPEYRWVYTPNGIKLFSQRRPAHKSFDTYHGAIQNLWADCLDASGSSSYIDSIPRLLKIGPQSLRRVAQPRRGNSIDARKEGLDQGRPDHWAREGNLEDISSWFWGVFMGSRSLRRLLCSGKAFDDISRNYKAKPLRYWAVSLLRDWATESLLPEAISRDWGSSVKSLTMACAGSDSVRT
ncbi:hypothetical protein GQ53DRAFT_522317 [Thozetella sp. PMI_491]|nr:hypothetical protein GQ53DRAFT_522317 [Thozetella sp. PMI_491]